jgi:hypothetical protein
MPAKPLSMNDTPHPLALALAEMARTTATTSPRYALIVGVGSGRNIAPLRDAGLHIDVWEEDAVRGEATAQRFAADAHVRITQTPYTQGTSTHRYAFVLSTHALLHGTSESIPAILATLAANITPDAHLMLTFGSSHDPRCGQGARLDGRTWVPREGPEADIPHVYYDATDIRALLQPFTIVTLTETNARENVGAWAHNPSEPPEIVHWYAHLTTREELA